MPCWEESPGQTTTTGKQTQTIPFRFGGGGLRLSKIPLEFSDKGPQVCCAHNFEPMAQNSTTSRLSGIFSHAHVARENDLNFSHLRTRTLRGFFDTMDPLPLWRRGIFCAIGKGGSCGEMGNKKARFAGETGGDRKTKGGFSHGEKGMGALRPLRRRNL